MEFSLKGKRTLITGVSGIVGRRITDAFAAEGARLFLTDATQSALSSCAEELGRRGLEVRQASADLRKADDVVALCRKVEDAWDGVDIVVNVAGLYPMQLVRDTSVTLWDDIFAVNVRAPFIIGRELGGLMRKRDIKGSIVNLTSGASRRTKVGHAAYSSSKAALDMLTKSLALEFAPAGIRVNAVGPGFAPGSEVSQLSTDYVASFSSSIPLGRVSGPLDAASAVLFLCSPQASFITGATLDVDGGRCAGSLDEETRTQLS